MLQVKVFHFNLHEINDDQMSKVVSEWLAQQEDILVYVEDSVPMEVNGHLIWLVWYENAIEKGAMSNRLANKD